MQIKIGVIVLYFGQWPDWIDYFIRSCESNTKIDFILINDSQEMLSYSDNIRSISLTLEEFNILATKNLGFEVKINNSYKICDFKPAFGKIFEEYLREYDYWGVSDVDLIFGDLSKLITEIIINKYDLISLYEGFISAPFYLMRNAPYLNYAFEQIEYYSNYLCKNEYYGIDENNKSARKKPVVLNRAYSVMKFFIGNLVNFYIFKFRMEEIKYKLYWYLKKEEITTPVDFTEVVHMLSKNKKIKSLFMGVMESDRSLCRKSIPHWKVDYIEGKVYISSLKREILVFHFTESKNNENFRILSVPGNFTITSQGISNYE